MDDMKRESRRAEREAIDDGTPELDAWYRAERAKLNADDLAPAELARAKTALMLEMGRRSKKLLARAKRQSSIPKLMERDVKEGRNILDRYRGRR